MYEYRQVLARMRQGDSDRQIAKAQLLGWPKVAQLRRVATEHGGLDAEQPMPEDEALAEVLLAKDPELRPASMVEPFASGSSPGRRKRRSNESCYSRSGTMPGAAGNSPPAH